MGCDATKFNCEATPASEGNNSMVFLDRHNVTCQDQTSGNYTPLGSFALAKGGNNQIQYNYGCLKTTSTPELPNTPTTTGFTNDGGGNVIYLDRQNVDCQGFPILQFQLQRDAAQKNIQYAYTCGTTPLTSLQKKTTDYTDEANLWSMVSGYKNTKTGKQITFMPACDKNSALSQFTILRQTDANNKPTGQMQYTYTCGTYAPASSQSSTTPSSSAPSTTSSSAPTSGSSTSLSTVGATGSPKTTQTSTPNTPTTSTSTTTSSSSSSYSPVVIGMSIGVGVILILIIILIVRRVVKKDKPTSLKKSTV